MSSPDDDERQPDSFLPSFANAENRQLNDDVQALTKQVENTGVAEDENKDRVNIMKEHLKNVQQELKYTQSRMEAKAKEIDTENHLKSLAERENGRLRQDMTKMGRERTELESKMLSLQTQYITYEEKMNQFKELMNWNQEELDQWALAQRQKDEDNDAIAKYRAQDAAKIKELELNLEKVSRVVVDKRQELDNEVVETQAAQIQLDKAAEDFRKLHAERQDLIRQWDEAVAAMRQRDAAIQAASQAFADKKAELRAKQGQLDSQARFLADEAANNKEIDARIAYKDREVAKNRETFQREQARLEDTSSQVEILKGTLSKAANDLSDGTARNVAAQQELEGKKARLDAARKKSALLKRKMDGEFSQLDTLAAQMEELERMRKTEELHLAVLAKEKVQLKNEQVKRERKLMDLQVKEREYISDIAGGQGQNKNMASRIRQLDEQVIRQQELLYNVEFQLQQMERKVARAGGVRSEEESRVLNARIEKLAALLEGVNSEHSMLLEQVKRSEDDLLKARRVNTSLRTDKTKIDQTISHLKLENEMTGRQVKSAIEEKEKAMVDHDVMKLDVKRLRDMLSMYADEVFSQENRKFQMTMSMQERKQEIEVHREGLRIDLKMVREDVHRITLELKERALRVEKLQNKFTTLSSKNKSVDDDGEEHSQAYYVIKAAQEREELQREGDELDSKIRKAEKETAALENTLKHLGAANHGYTASFKKVDGSAANQERAVLKDKLDRSYDKLTFKRQEEKQLVDDVRASEGRLNSLTTEQRSMAALAEQLLRKKNEAQRAVDEQGVKMRRAQAAMDKHRKVLGVAAGSPQDKELELADVRDTTKAMLNELRTLAMQNPGAGIMDMCELANIKFPPSGASTPSLRGGDNGSRPQSGRSNGSVGSLPSVRSVGRGGGSPAGSRPMSGVSQRSAAIRNIGL